MYLTVMTNNFSGPQWVNKQDLFSTNSQFQDLYRPEILCHFSMGTLEPDTDHVQSLKRGEVGTVWSTVTGSPGLSYWKYYANLFVDGHSFIYIQYLTSCFDNPSPCAAPCESLWVYWLPAYPGASQYVPSKVPFQWGLSALRPTSPGPKQD